VQDAILNQPAVPVRQLNSSLSFKLEQIVGRALEKDREKRYQSAAEMRADLELVRDGSRPAKGALWKWFVAPGVFIALALGGVLYWHSRNTFRLTASDTVVFAEPTNLTGDRIFDDVLNTALRVELEQTPFLNLLAPDKIRRTLSLLNHPQDVEVSPELARDICLRTNSKAVVASSIADVGNRFRIELKGIDCRFGKVFVEVQQEAAGRNDVVHAVGIAGGKLRRKLGEPDASLRRFNKPLDEAMTSSVEALEAYAVGVRRSADLGSFEAIPYLKSAVELDPNFALAYAKLGNESDNGNAGDGREARQYFRKAYELRDRLSERERLYVEGHYYNNATGEVGKAAQIWLDWIKTYPNDSRPYVNLGNLYAYSGQYEKAVSVTREALRLQPGYSPAAENLMAFNIAMNRLDDARTTLQDLRVRKLHGTGVHFCGYLLAFLESDAAAMREQFNEGMSLPRNDSFMLSIKSDTEAYYGSLRTARQLSQRAAESASRIGAVELAAKWRALHALREAEIGNRDTARKSAIEALSKSRGREVEPPAALALAFAGDRAGAQSLINKLNQEYPVDSGMKYYWLPTLRAAVQLEDGKAQEAIGTLVATVDYELGMPYGFGTFGNLHPVYVRGLALLNAGHAQQAAAEFQKMIDHPGVVLNFVTGALAHLQLGRAQVMMGDKEGARKSYQNFLTLWKDADPDIPIYRQAKAEYAKLR
jgi:tetratricopeptide (TPR) repeat protein